MCTRRISLQRYYASSNIRFRGFSSDGKNGGFLVVQCGTALPLIELYPGHWLYIFSKIAIPVSQLKFFCFLQVVPWLSGFGLEPVQLFELILLSSHAHLPAQSAADPRRGYDLTAVGLCNAMSGPFVARGA